MAITTIYTYPLNGTQRDFTISFEYLARRFVVVTLIGANRRELTLTADFRFISKTLVQLNKAWGPSDGYERIEIRRNTSATDRLVDFADGSILRAAELNTSQVQTLHVAEEARNMVADTISENSDGDLDARGRRLVNLADALSPDHAVTLRQEQEWAQSTLGNRNAAEAAAQLSVDAKNTAVTAKDTAVAQATVSTTKASESLASAVRSEAAAATIGGNVGLSQAARDAAISAKDQTVTLKSQAETAKTGAETAKSNAESLVTNATSTVNTVRSAAFQLGMSSWGFRANPWEGFGVDDGQQLDRALYPDFAAALDAGKLPTTTEAIWRTQPEMRGCFVANSSTGKFRMRDLNGKYVGSLGAVTIRGDGSMSLVANGKIQQDQLQDFRISSSRFAVDRLNPTGFHTATNNLTYNIGGATAANVDSVIHNSGYPSGMPAGDSALVPSAARVGSETRMLNVTVCYMTRLFGSIGALGSAEAASLATSYAALAARMSTAEGRLTSLEGKFLTTGNAWIASGKYEFLHGLPGTPLSLDFLLVNVTPEQNYAVGAHARIAPLFGSTAGAVYGVQLSADATKVYAKIGSGGIALAPNEAHGVAGGGYTTVAPANWRFTMLAKLF